MKIHQQDSQKPIDFAFARPRPLFPSPIISKPARRHGNEWNERESNENENFLNETETNEWKIIYGPAEKFNLKSE